MLQKYARGLSSIEVLLPILFFVTHGFCLGAKQNEFSNWTIRAFSAPKDLPNEVVRDAIMTRDGSVWLASWGGGIVIMDGTHRRIVNMDNGLISNDVRLLEEDNKGRVWVGTPNGISCIHQDRIDNFTAESFPGHPPNDSISAIECMKNGEVWIGNGSAYLYSWIPAANDNDVRKGKWKLIHQFTENSDAIIEDIQQNDNHEIWIAVNRVGMVHFHSSDEYKILSWDQCPQEKDRVCKEFVFNPLNHLFFISRGTVLECADGQVLSTKGTPFETTCLQWAFGKLLLGTREGLFILNDEEWEFCPLTPDKRRLHIESISYLEDQSLWICTRSGVYRFTKPTWTKQSIPDLQTTFISESLTNNDQHQLFCVDMNCTLWRYSQHQWKSLYQFQYIENDFEAFDINIQKNRLVLCSRNRYIEFDLSKLRIMKEIPLPGDLHVGGDKPIFLPDEEHIWFTGEQGVVKWNGEQYVPVFPLSNHPNQVVYSLLETSLGEYWIGGRGWIEHWIHGEPRETNIPPSFMEESSKIVASLQTQDGELWFSRLGLGLLRYQDNQWIQESISSGLKSNYILSLYQSSDGTIWAGDRNQGVMSFKDGRWIQYGYENGIPVGPVISIAEDEEGRIWIGIMNEGIYAFDQDNNAPATEIVSAPDHLIPDARGVFSFQGYDAWNHTSRNELVFSWRIVDSAAQRVFHDWTSFSGKTSAWIPPLPPGQYIFEVVSQDKFRNTSQEPAHVHFVVNPYFWTTYSFRIPVAFAAFFALLSAFLGWRHYQRVREELKIEKDSFQEFCEATQIGIYKIFDPYELIYVNSAMAHITGFSSSEEMMNHPHPFQWENEAKYRQFLHSLLNGKKFSPITLKGKQPKTGKNFWVRLYGVRKGEEIDILAVDLTTQKQLEKEIVWMSTKEQQKIGRDLHDSILQELTGISFLAQLVLSNGENGKSHDMKELETIVQMLDDVRLKTRKLSKGLAPLTIGKLGFHAALQELVSATQKLYKINCQYESDLTIRIDNEEAELHLYHIAHEAINNAAKHSKANQIQLKLEQNRNSILLRIQDDGIGFCETDDHGGMGIQIMRLRAGIILADLNIYAGKGKGTVVECRYTLRDQNETQPYSYEKERIAMQ